MILSQKILCEMVKNISARRHGIFGTDCKCAFLKSGEILAAVFLTICEIEKFLTRICSRKN